ncbi:MAG: hypothetical protein HY719_10540 [Planctomycetes bacterium]|nr:hypothetical protein [Planctomycetota bacterium]
MRMVRLLPPGRAAAITLFAALLLRAGFAFGAADPLLLPDAKVYHRMALRLVARGEMVGEARPERPGLREGPPERAAFWPALYPLFLAGCLAAGGGAAALAAQAALSTATVLLVGHLACGLAGHDGDPGGGGGAEAGGVAAVAAMALAATHPFFIFYSGQFLTETLTLALLAGAVLAARRAFQPPAGNVRPPASLGWGAVAGVLAGLAALARAAFGGLPLALAAVGLVASPGGWRSRASRTAAAGVLLGAALALAPWATRNGVVLGRFVPLTTQGGDALYEALGPGATGAPRRDGLAWPAEVDNLGEVERSAVLTRLALRHAVEHPGDTWALAGEKIARTWSPTLHADEHRTLARDAVLAATWTVAVTLAAAGLGVRLVQRPRRWRALALPLAPVVYVFVSHAVFIGSVRYRLPAEPFILAIAGAGAADLWGAARRRRRSA